MNFSVQKIWQYVQKINPGLGFAVLLVLFSVIYDYPSVVMKRPQSVHHWRQSDCASITLNYYQTGMKFFEPQTHNLTSDNNTTGFNATSEIPFGYYFIASLYKVFGPHDFIYRSINTLLFLIGLFFLFKLIFLLTGSFFWSAFASLLFFTSPVLVYYGNNFLTDSTALAMSFVAWFYFSKYYIGKQSKFFYLSMLFFFIAGSYKITALISLVAIAAAFFAEITGMLKFEKSNSIFAKPWQQAGVIGLIFIVIASWALYARNYNLAHKSMYFSTQTFPVWNVSSDEMPKIIENIRVLWLNQYFHVATLWFLLAAFIAVVFYIRKANKLYFTITILMLIGVVLYIILWFWTFKDHDYYTINLYILPVFVLLNFILLLKNHFQALYASKIVRGLFLLFLLFNLNHAQKQQFSRYNHWWTEHPEYKDYHDITPYLRSLGIAPLDTVICLPDMSHFTLYLMNQRGWTECMGCNSDSIEISESINRGAKYLIINGEEVLNRNYLQSFLQHKIGEYKQVKIYKVH